MYKIEKGKKLKSYCRKKDSSKYPFKNMKIGDSFLVPHDKDLCGSNLKNQIRVRTAATNYCKFNNPKLKFLTQTEEKGIRVFRIK